MRHGGTCKHDSNFTSTSGRHCQHAQAVALHIHAVASIELMSGALSRPSTWTPAASLSVRDSERLCATPLAAAINGGCCSSCAGSSVSLIRMLLSTALVPCIASEHWLVCSVPCCSGVMPKLAQVSLAQSSCHRTYVCNGAALPAAGHYGAGVAGQSAAACGQQGYRADCWVLMTSRVVVQRCCAAAAAQLPPVLWIQGPCPGSWALAAGRHWPAKQNVARHQALACCCCWQALPQMRHRV